MDPQDDEVVDELAAPPLAPRSLQPDLSSQISELISIRDGSAKLLVEERKVLEQDRAALARKQAAQLDAEAEVARLRAELASLEATQTASGCTMQRYREDIARTTAITSDLEHELQDLSSCEEKLAAMLAAVNDIQAQAAEAAQAARDAHSQTAPAHQLRAMQAQCAQLSAEANRKRQTEIPAAEEQVRQLTQKLSDARTCDEQLDETIKATQQQIAQWDATIRNQQAKIMALSQQQLSPGGQPAVQAPAYRLKQEILTLRRHETELQQQLAAAEHALLEITTMYEALAC
jgi:chromosome segregation ATPase